MGTRARFALVQADAGQLLQLAAALQPSLSDLPNPISLSLDMFEVSFAAPPTVALELVAFRSKEVPSFYTTPAVVMDLRAPQSSDPEVLSAWHAALRTPAFVIAKLASDLLGLGLALIYSDGSCSSGLAEFRVGAPAAGVLYGLAGSEVLLAFGANGVVHGHPKPLDGTFGYSDFLQREVQLRFGNAAPDISDLFDQFVYQGRIALMRNGQLVAPPVYEAPPPDAFKHP